MTTHNNQEDETLKPEGSLSSPISSSQQDSTPEPDADLVSTIADASPTAQRATVSLDQGPTHTQAKPFVSEAAPKTKKPLLGMALFTSGISMGVLGCGLVLAKGPFAEVAEMLRPLAERGLTGGSMILTGMVLTAMAIVERQLRKQGQALEAQEANAAILQDIYGSMATIDNRFDQINTNERTVYAEANMMRNELHQFIVSQDGKEDQTGIFHVAASVDKLSAQVDRTLKEFGNDLQAKLRTAQEQTEATNKKLEAKLCELEPQELPDNSELVAVQTDIVQRLKSMEADLCETRAQLGQVGDSVRTHVQETLDSKLEDLQPQDTYDDSHMLTAQVQLDERLCRMEETFLATQERLAQIGDCVQSTVQNTIEEKLETLQPHEVYDDTAMLAGQSELCDRLSSVEENIRGTQERFEQIGDCVSNAVHESIQEIKPSETRDDAAMLAGQSEIVCRLQELESHLESTRARFGEVQEAIQSSVQEALKDNLNSTVEHAVDSRIDQFRSELEQVSATVEAAVKSALESAPTIAPAETCGTDRDQQALQTFLTSEKSNSPTVQSWPLESSDETPKAPRVQERPPLEILHMPSEEEMISAIDVEQDQMAHALNHLFQPITPDQEDEMDIAEELFLDNIPQRFDGPSGTKPTQVHLDGPIGPMPFSSNGPSPIPGTPGSPFPAPVPLKPTDSDDAPDSPSEGPSNFQKPYEPPSDDTGFRFPGWN